MNWIISLGVTLIIMVIGLYFVIEHYQDEISKLKKRIDFMEMRYNEMNNRLMKNEYRNT